MKLRQRACILWRYGCNAWTPWPEHSPLLVGNDFMTLTEFAKILLSQFKDVVEMIHCNMLQCAVILL